MSEPFAKTLARVIGRVPSNEETGEALSRIRELAEVLEDIRRGRNGMRCANARTPDEKDEVLEVPEVPAENP